MTTPHDCHHVDSVHYADGMCKLQKPGGQDLSVMSKR